MVYDDTITGQETGGLKMNSIDIQKEFFLSGATLDVEYRIRQLRSLYNIIQI